MTKNKSGILLVDKPEGMSSAAAISKIKRKWGWDKIGHGGTLDPFASGVLVVLVGEATKISRFFLGGNKKYLARAQIGERKDTGDLTGQTIAQSPNRPNLPEWKSVAARFIGKSQQRPPNYSAVKINGKPAYARTRSGENIEIAPKEIEIQSLDVLDLAHDQLIFRVDCAGGTYIRVLAEDLAKQCQTEAFLTHLRREASGHFQIKDALPLSVCEESEPYLIPIAAALPELPILTLPDKNLSLIRQGRIDQLEPLFTQARSFISQDLPYALLSSSQDRLQMPTALLEWNSLTERLEIARVFQLE